MGNVKIQTKTLNPELRRKMDACWRGQLSVGRTDLSLRQSAAETGARADGTGSRSGSCGCPHATHCCTESLLNMTYLGLRFSHNINGVAMHHGAVPPGNVSAVSDTRDHEWRTCSHMDYPGFSKSLRHTHSGVATRQCLPQVRLKRSGRRTSSRTWRSWRR